MNTAWQDEIDKLAERIERVLKKLTTAERLREAEQLIDAMELLDVETAAYFRGRYDNGGICGEGKNIQGPNDNRQMVCSII